MDFKEKLAQELKISCVDRKANAIKQAVYDALLEFCNQQSEFAQAIEQSDKTLNDCCKHCVDGVGTSISDLEVYEKAVKFYFPTATINFSMTVDLCGDTGHQDPPIKVKCIHVSLEDLLDF